MDVNACGALSQEVEAAALCYEQVFPAIERLAHFCFEFIKIIYLFPMVTCTCLHACILTLIDMVFIHSTLELK